MSKVKYLELKNTLESLISVDEYSPKLGNEKEIIVLTFFCMNYDVAKDLEDFLNKSAAEILDVEASDSADENNNFPVFIEIKRSPGFWADFFRIIKDVERLTGEMSWKVTTYLHALPLPIDEVREKGMIITNPENYMTKAEFDRTIRNKIKSFFDQSGASNADLVDETTLVSKNGIYESTNSFNSIVSTEKAVEMYEKEKSLMFEDVAIRKLKAIYENCDIFQTTEKIFIDNRKGDVLVLNRHYE